MRLQDLLPCPLGKKIMCIIFFQAGTDWFLARSGFQVSSFNFFFPISDHGQGLGSVRIVKNCDLGPENAALGLRPRAAFSRPQSQFFTKRTSQQANNIYILVLFPFLRGFGLSRRRIQNNATNTSPIRTGQ